MGLYIAKRLVWLVPVLFVISVIVFSIVHLIPGDPATVLLGTEAADPSLLETMKQKYGLDKPVYVQYVLWLQRVLHGDLGLSVTTGRSVSKLVAERIPYTLELGLYALALALSLAIPLGAFAAVRKTKGVQWTFQTLTQRTPGLVYDCELSLLHRESSGKSALLFPPRLYASPPHGSEHRSRHKGVHA